MLKVDSPYTLNLCEVYYDDLYLHIVMGCMDNAQDLSEAFKELPDNRFNEETVKNIVI
jgi:hypothetical protein